MENIFLLGILIAVYVGLRWGFRAYVATSGTSKEQVNGNNKPSLLVSSRTLIRVDNHGEYLGQPLVILMFEGAETYSGTEEDSEPMWCARTVAEQPLPYTFKAEPGYFSPMDLTDHVTHSLASRYSIGNAEDLIWEQEGQWFELTLEHDWIMLSVRDEREEESFGAVTFFVGDQFDMAFSTPVMTRIHPTFGAYPDDLAPDQARMFVERMPEALLKRVYDFCRFAQGEIIADQNSVLFDGTVWAIDVELVDAFLSECIELSAQLRALGDPATSTVLAPIVPSHGSDTDAIW